MILAPEVSMNQLSTLGFLSPDGRSYSFDERANGYAKGEGAGIVILKRLTDALKDRDTIRAIVRSTSVNQDGHTPGIIQPSRQAQAEISGMPTPPQVLSSTRLYTLRRMARALRLVTHWKRALSTMPSADPRRILFTSEV